MNKVIKLILLAGFMLVPLVSQANYDQPHTSQMGVNCGNCHWIGGGSAPWAGVTPPAGWLPQDITVNNLRCLACHDGSNPSIPMANIHSASTTSTQYWNGSWTTECVTCHNPHQQRQWRAWRTDPDIYLANGTFTLSGVGTYDSVNNRTPITLSSPLTQEFQGYYFVPDRNYPFLYQIISPTQNQTTFYVRGKVNTTYVRGGGYGIIYGMMIKDSITYRNPGGQTLTSSIKFFRPEGIKSFIDPDNYSTSICQACHTQTVNFTRTNPTHATSIEPGQYCLNPTSGCHATHPEAFKIAGAKCGVCHGVPPSYYNSPSDHNLVKKIKIDNVEYETYTGVTTPGAHVRHSNASQMQFSRRSIGCMECHNGGMQPLEQDPTIGDYKIQIGFMMTPVNYTGGSYDGSSSLQNTFTYQAVSPTTVTTNNTLTCSSIYCHGSTIGGAVNPTWTGSINCGDCHKASASNPPTLGSHVKHAGDTSTIQSAIACSQCHGHSGLASSVHVDGSATWNLNTGNPLFGSSAVYRGLNAGSVNPVPSTTYGQCTNLYCHSNASPMGGTNVFQTVTWGGSPMACNSCHSGAGDSLPTWSASHTKHVNTYPYNCSHCHSSVASNNTTIYDKTKHVNALKEIAFNTMNPLGSYSSPNCSNLYCHSNANPYGGTNIYNTVSWTASVNCSSCHSGAGDTSPTWSPPHTVHINSYASNSNFTCNACHSSTAANNTTISGYDVHVNAIKEVIFNTFSNASATYNPDSHQCSNTYCHSAGTGGTNHSGDTRPVADNTATWSGNVTCGSCHGGGNSTGMPNYPNNSPKANSHVRHSQDCSICHAGTTTDGVTITDKSKHVNKLYDLQPKTGYTFTYAYNASGGSCSNISCHFNQSAIWGQTLTCSSCHASPPATGAHLTHSGALNSSTSQYGNDGRFSVAGAYGFNCGNCHPLDISYHANGTIEIELYNASASGFKANNPATASKTGTGNSTICDNVYCHSNGAEGANRAYKTTPPWGSTFGANKCGGCHDNPPQYAGQSHYNASGFMGKEGGHLVGIHFDNIYTGSVGLASAGTGDTNSHGNSLYSTTITCYICHATVVSSTPDTYALYNVASSAMKCSNCHTSVTPTPLQNGVISDKSLHINASKDVAIVNAFTMKSKAQLRDDSRPALWTRNGGYKVAGAYDSALINSSDWNPSTKTCTTACHNNQPVQWGATNVTCNSCHTDL